MDAVKGFLRYLYEHAILILALLIICAVIVLLWLQSGGTRNNVLKPRYHFCFIAQNSIDPFGDEVMKGAEKSSKENNVAIEFNAPRFNAPEEELKMLDIAVISNADGIITHVPGGMGFTALIEEAYNRGIPVITLENDDSASKRYAFVGTNSFELGKEAARLMVEATGGRADIAVISNSDLVQGSIA